MAGKGGAWKVAYADFVTAMMALFMVLWISSQDKEILVATSRYFQSPFNSPMDATTGILPFDNNKPSTPSSSKDTSDKGPGKDSTNRDVDLQFLNSVAKDFFRMMHLDEDVAEKPIDIQVTSDGIRVNLFNRARQPVFEGNTAELTEWGKFVMQSLAWIIDRNKFYVVIEGHTKSGIQMPNEDYTVWELSVDRANSARRYLTRYAVDDKLIDRVSGYADTRPMPGEKPDADSNQRVSLSLSVGRPKSKEAKPATEKPKASLVPLTDPKPPAKTAPAPGSPGTAPSSTKAKPKFQSRRRPQGAPLPVRT